MTGAYPLQAGRLSGTSSFRRMVFQAYVLLGMKLAPTVTAIGLFRNTLRTMRTNDGVTHVDRHAACAQFASNQNGVFFADVADRQFNLARLRHDHKLPYFVRLVGVTVVGSINCGTYLAEVLPQGLFAVHTFSIEQNKTKKKPLEWLEGYKKRRV